MRKILIARLILGVSTLPFVGHHAFAEVVPVMSAKPVDAKDTKADTTPAIVPEMEVFDITKGFSSVASKTIPSVVNVSTTQVIEKAPHQNMPQFAPGSPFEEFFKEFFDHAERPRRVQSLGSGFIIKADDKTALIVTNYHVIADARKIAVFLHDGSEIEATVHSKDERTDIALLEVKLDNLPPEKRKLHPIKWANSHQAKVGDWILAIGNPFGLGSTVTNGIISNRSRNIGVRGGKTQVSEYVDDFIQHTASINMGNSGGPLFNLSGEVVGINAAIFSPSGGNVGIGFAIPSDVAQETIKQLIEFGRTRRGWLGVRIQNVGDEMAEGLGLPKGTRGSIVGSVTPNGPADLAKIEPGDVILQFDGKDINDQTGLPRLVGQTPVGKTAKVKLWRKGKEITTDITLGEFETSLDQPETTKKNETKSVIDVAVVLGLKLSALVPELYPKFGLKENVKGIVVMGVDHNTPAEQVGFKPGDVIETVNQIPVTKPEEFAQLVGDAKKQNRKAVVIRVNRGGDPIYVPMPLEIEDLSPKAPKVK